MDPTAIAHAALSEEQRASLVDAARAASANAYAPYSRFHVGAAVLGDDGRIWSGANVENASYGLTSCAERNAIFAAVFGGMKRVVAVAIHTPTDAPTAPCGACRQVIFEFGPGARVLSCCDGEDVRETSIDALLPDAFGPLDLS